MTRVSLETCLEVEDNSFLRGLLQEDGFSLDCYCPILLSLLFFGGSPRLGATLKYGLLAIQFLVVNNNGQ
jgi:hypothetical protein